MNHRETQQDGTGANRDPGARAYENLPSITDRHAEGGGGRDDSFGPSALGGYGDFGARADRGGHEVGREAQGVPARRGRGPKNAVRPDSLVAEELNERFGDEDGLDAGEILLGVEDGRVLLTGEVPEGWMAQRAGEIAEAIRGVKAVENRIRVDDGSASFGSGGAVRAGHGQPGSGFSSSPPNADWSARDDRVD